VRLAEINRFVGSHLLLFVICACSSLLRGDQILQDRQDQRRCFRPVDCPGHTGGSALRMNRGRMATSNTPFSIGPTPSWVSVRCGRTLAARAVVREALGDPQWTLHGRTRKRKVRAVQLGLNIRNVLVTVALRARICREQ
jgi:hypothetical protein